MSDHIQEEDPNQCWCGKYCEGPCPPPWSKMKTKDAMTKEAELRAEIERYKIEIEQTWDEHAIKDLIQNRDRLREENAKLKEQLKAANEREEALLAVNNAAEMNEAKLQAEIELLKQELMQRDLSAYGNYIEKDGKRVSPEEFYKSPEEQRLEAENANLRRVVAHYRSLVERLRVEIKEMADKLDSDCGNPDLVQDQVYRLWKIAESAQAERLSDSEGSSADVMGNCRHENGTWFDRTITPRQDGRERMADICNDCGKEVLGKEDR